jgi:hypothetical protein
MLLSHSGLPRKRLQWNVFARKNIGTESAVFAEQKCAQEKKFLS